MRFLLLLVLLTPLLEKGYAQNFKQYTFENFHTGNSGLINDHIREIFIDSRGRTWITSNEQGLHLYNPDKKTLTHKDFAENKKSWWLNDIEETEDGKLIFSGYQGFLMLFDPKTEAWDSITMPVREQPWRMAKNHKGTFLISPEISWSYLYQYRNGTFTILEDGMGDGMGIDIMDNGDALVSFRKGVKLFRMQPDGSYSKADSEVILDIGSYTALRKENGTIWIATFEDQLLYRWRNGKTREFKELPEDIYYDWNGNWRYVIHCLTICPDGRIMIGTQFGAHLAIRNTDGRWETYSLPIKEGYTGTDGIERLVWDNRDSSLWIATYGNGVYHWVPGEEEEVIDSIPEVDPGLIADGTAIDYIPDDTRTVRTAKHIVTKTAPGIIEIWDSQRVDGDTVSVYINGELVLEEYALTAERHQIKFEFHSGDNEVLLYAHNLGEISPNTMAMRLVFEGETHRLSLRSDMGYCERLIVRYDGE